MPEQGPTLGVRLGFDLSAVSLAMSYTTNQGKE